MARSDCSLTIKNKKDDSVHFANLKPLMYPVTLPDRIIMSKLGGT